MPLGCPSKWLLQDEWLLVGGTTFHWQLMVSSAALWRQCVSVVLDLWEVDEDSGVSSCSSVLVENYMDLRRLGSAASDFHDNADAGDVSEEPDVDYDV